MTFLNLAVFTDDERYSMSGLSDFTAAGHSLVCFDIFSVDFSPEKYSEFSSIFIDLSNPAGSGELPFEGKKLKLLNKPVLISPKDNNLPLQLRDEPDYYSIVTLPVTSAQLCNSIASQTEIFRLNKKLRIIQGSYAEEANYREILTDIIQAVNSSLELEEVMDTVMEKTKSLFQAEGWSIMLLNEDNTELVFEKVDGKKGSKLESFSIKVGEGIAGWVAKTRQPIIVNNASQDKRFYSDVDRMTNLTTHSVLCVPLISREKILGVVEIINKAGQEGFTLKDQNVLMTLVGPASIAIENAQLFRRSNYHSITDDLTKLYNSRYFNDTLTTEVERARRYNTSVSLIFLDLDNFKRINDTHGHLAGSRTIFEAAKIIEDAIRDIDVASRYGGDEFTVILPNTDSEGGVAVAERIREGVESAVFLKSMGLEESVTASLGVATYPEVAHSKESLIRQADSAMYFVKGNGKNGVYLAGK